MSRPILTSDPTVLERHESAWLGASTIHLRWMAELPPSAGRLLGALQGYSLNSARCIVMQILVVPDGVERLL